jgi:hypothetical protein
MLSRQRERGASAVLVAGSLVLLLGVLAVALDVSAAFNERNQNQNAGDNGVMAGAIEKAVANPDPQLIVTSALDIIQSNLTAEFPGGQTDADWISMWRTCADDGNPNWIPLPEPASWGAGPGATLDCISQTTSLLRVRIPDQLVGTTFGAVLGSSSLTTHAVSIAKTAMTGNAPPVVPFGINSGASAGEFCLSSASSGTAHPPCTGSQTGAFGPIISPLFGDFGSHTPECTGNTIRWFERNLVWGLDHRLSAWPHEAMVPTPSPWPGQAALDALADINRDECVLDPDGNAAPANGIPINTVKVDSGFPDPGLTNALVSDLLFEGRPSRLQLPTTATRPLMNQLEPWDVDNVGPWTFLTEASPVADCQGSSYTSALTTDAKTAMFEACLSAPGAGEIFSPGITASPRFVWAPEYVYESPPGSKYTPIRGFRPVFLAGVWMNCPNPSSGQPCGAIFFPDEDVTDPICDGPFPSCKKVTVDQISAWMLPDAALPTSVFDDFDAAFDNLEAQLFQ